jgi:hypothetical protein
MCRAHLEYGSFRICRSLICQQPLNDRWRIYFLRQFRGHPRIFLDAYYRKHTVDKFFDLFGNIEALRIEEVDADVGINDVGKLAIVK